MADSKQNPEKPVTNDARVQAFLSELERLTAQHGLAVCFDEEHGTVVRGVSSETMKRGEIIYRTLAYDFARGQYKALRVMDGTIWS